MNNYKDIIKTQIGQTCFRDILAMLDTKFSEAVERLKRQEKVAPVFKYVKDGERGRN